MRADYTPGLEPDADLERSGLEQRRRGLPRYGNKRQRPMLSTFGLRNARGMRALMLEPTSETARQRDPIAEYLEGRDPLHHDLCIRLDVAGREPRGAEGVAKLCG